MTGFRSSKRASWNNWRSGQGIVSTKSPFSTGEVLLRGGEFFPVRTAVRLEGSTLGGSILK